MLSVDRGNPFGPFSLTPDVRCRQNRAHADVRAPLVLASGPMPGVRARG
jgi:hypothetical protein